LSSTLKKKNACPIKYYRKELHAGGEGFRKQKALNWKQNRFV
jgi:hypothetical protein